MTTMMTPMQFEYPILATGRALPRECVTNHDLVARLAARGIETSDDWIKERTGITQRYYCGDGESVFTLARDATAKAIEKAGIDKQKIGVLVVATCTPNQNFPSVAAQIHGDLGFSAHCMALDINAACSGFVHGISVAKGLLDTLNADFAVVIGAEQLSKLLDFDDRTTCVLFGDGAGAVVIERRPFVDGVLPQGVLQVSSGSAGALGPSLTTATGAIVMNGRDVFKQAVRQMGAVPPTLATLGLTMDDVDHVVPHQANVRILEASAKSLGIDEQKVVKTVPLHANTSAASIPLALDVANELGRFKKGDIILLQAFGAGFVWGDVLLRW